MPGTSARSEPTRRAILVAARALFARDGYAATTVRAIAAHADVDPALVVRYFGGKRGLYDATVEVDLDLPDLSAVPRSRIGARVVEEFLARWDGPDGEPLRVLLSAAATDGEAAARIRAVFADQVRPALVRSVTDHAERRVQLVVTVLMGLALTRYVLRIDPAHSQSPARLVAVFGPAIQAHLTGRMAAGSALAE